MSPQLASGRGGESDAGAFGRLQRKSSALPMSDINITPLVDVMLVLVVIFIITAPLLASSIRLNLPKSDAARALDTPRFVTLVVDRAGRVFLDDRPTTLAALSGELAEAARKNPDTEVQLRADAAVSYGTVVEVMGVAQKAGLNRIGFVAEAPVPEKR